jgi:hypothetical protein
MKKNTLMLTIGLILVLLPSCGSPDSESAGTTPEQKAEPVAEELTSYGEGVTLEKSTSIADILGSPETYEGQQVMIEGEVKDVCAKMGCWIEVAGKSSSIQVKVEDGVIVFPDTMKGQFVKAEGTVERLTLTKEEYVARLEHEAEEKGVEFDESSIGDPPYEIIRLKGTGAVAAGK